MFGDYFWLLDVTKLFLDDLGFKLGKALLAGFLLGQCRQGELSRWLEEGKDAFHIDKGHASDLSYCRLDLFVIRSHAVMEWILLADQRLKTLYYRARLIMMTSTQLKTTRHKRGTRHDGIDRGASSQPKSLHDARRDKKTDGRTEDKGEPLLGVELVPKGGETKGGIEEELVGLVEAKALGIDVQHVVLGTFVLFGLHPTKLLEPLDLKLRRIPGQGIFSLRRR